MTCESSRCLGDTGLKLGVCTPPARRRHFPKQGRDLQIGWNCCSGRSWRCRRPPAVDWTAGWCLWRAVTANRPGVRKAHTPTTLSNAKRPLRTRVLDAAGGGLKSTCPRRFRSIYSFLSTDFNLLVGLCLPTLWIQSGVLEPGTQQWVRISKHSWPGLPHLLCFTPQPWGAGTPAGRRVEQEGASPRCSDLTLDYPYPFSTQLLFLPVAPPSPPSSLRGTGTLRKMKQFLLLKQGCRHSCVSQTFIFGTHFRTLLKCRWGSSRSKAGPESLHF